MQKFRSLAGNFDQFWPSFSLADFSVSKQAFSRFSDSDRTTARAAPLQLAVTSRLGTPSATATSCRLKGMARMNLNMAVVLLASGHFAQVFHHSTMPRFVSGASASCRSLQQQRKPADDQWAGHGAAERRLAHAVMDAVADIDAEKHRRHPDGRREPPHP